MSFVLGLAVVSCGGTDTGSPTSSTSEERASEDGDATATGHVEEPSTIDVQCEIGTGIDELPYDSKRLGILGDVPTDARWLRRTFRIDNPAGRAVAFEPGVTVRYVDADGETIAEIDDVDRLVPAFTVASGQATVRTMTAIDGVNAGSFLATDAATIDEILSRTASCTLVDPPEAVLANDLIAPPAGVEFTTTGPCTISADRGQVEQVVRVVNDSSRPVAADALLEVLNDAGDRIGVLGGGGMNVVDPGNSTEFTASGASFTIADDPIDSCEILSTGPASPSLALTTSIEVMVDPTRATKAVVDGDGNVLLAARDDRVLPVSFLHGGDGSSPRPLVVWLHGLGGISVPGEPIPTHLAEAGYVVAIINQPETSEPVVSIHGYPLLPGDVQAVLDALEDPADGFADELASVVDMERIAVAGHSIGTTAALAFAGHPCCEDDRIHAAVTFGASHRFTFDGGEYRFSRIPLLLVNGTEDVIAAHSEAEELLAGAERNTSLLSLDGADHFAPVYGNAGDAAAELARSAMIAFLDVHVAGVATSEALDAYDLSTTEE